MNIPLKIILLTCFITSFHNCIYAQTYREKVLSLETKRGGTPEKKNMEVHATLLKPGSYSILINIYDQENVSEREKVLCVVKNSGVIHRINPIDQKKPMNCKYRFSYTPGFEPKKVDSAFIYRLPYSCYKPEAVQVGYLYNIDQRYFNRSRAKNWTSLQFHLEKGDTVFAIRKGIVTRIQDEFEPVEREERVSYSSNRNSITIEHGDGTICHYTVLEKESFMVSEGDVVYPGTPLGLCGLHNIKHEDYQVRLSISYPVVNREYDMEDKKSSAFINHYYNPVFATKDGNIKLVHRQPYRAICSDEIIQKEMTKRELKKYAKTK